MSCLSSMLPGTTKRQQKPATPSRSFDLKPPAPMTIREHPLAWRWTDPRHALLPDSTLARIEPVESGEAKHLFQRSLRFLGRDCLSPDVFETVTRGSADISANVGCVWLREQHADLTTRVYISWEQDVAVRTTWEIFTANWDDFCYTSSADGIVWPESESWALLYHHEQE